MDISTFEIKICGQNLCTEKDGFCKSGHTHTNTHTHIQTHIHTHPHAHAHAHAHTHRDGGNALHDL